MLIYSATRAEFAEDIQKDQVTRLIQEDYTAKIGNRPPEAEINAWTNSLNQMESVLTLGEIEPDAGIAIEFQIPLTSKRVDFILSGRNQKEQETVVIVELKQWQAANKTTKPGIVKTILGGAPVEVTHPSYQAWTYAAFIKEYNLEVQTSGIQLKPCAYLHNCLRGDEISSTFYEDEIRRAPLFLRQDDNSLAQFLNQQIRSGDDSEILQRIENSELRPSKHLIEYLTSLLKGNDEFTLIDEQKLVYETALELANRASDGPKQVMLVHGGPGTGKSVLAVNLLAKLTSQEKMAQYVTRNTTPRDVYQAKLTGSFRRTEIGNLFKSAGSYVKEPKQKMDALLVDEAHRLSPKSGVFGHLGENQIKEIIRASNFSLFFLDENQKVLWNDIGDSNEIRKRALEQHATITEINLASQFRCNGSDGYLTWLNDALQFDTQNPTSTRVYSLDQINYDFRVFDTPNELRERITDLSTEGKQSRMVAGFCWDWRGRRNPNVEDVVIPEHNFAMRWNLTEHGTKWIITPESVSEIGCIHTCQGLELDYVGVIIGDDLIVRNGIIQTNPLKRSKDDRSIRGFKKALGEDPIAALRKGDQIIKNTYRTLMTRGLKGCYLFCVDEETNDYFKKFLRL